MKSFLLLTFLFFSQAAFEQQQSLFRIVQNNKVGYINIEGKIEIQPQYSNGTDFSEGFAAVRLNGLYGFINQSGNYVIKPQFDYALNFNNELALVYKSAKPYFINKNGEVVLQSIYQSLSFIDSYKAIITTLSGRQGIIDLKNKKLVIDTVFSSIDYYQNGIAIVTEYTNSKSHTYNDRIAIIDSNGNFIVPYGTYKFIKPFIDGYAVVSIENPNHKGDDVDGLIDIKGKLLFRRPFKNNSYLDGDFHDGYAKVALYKYWLPEQKGTTYSSDKTYQGFIDRENKLVLNDTNYKYVNDFSEGRSFVKKTNDEYILIDKNFKQVGSNIFLNASNSFFHNGYAIVATSHGYSIIDTTGNYIIKSQYDDITNEGAINGCFFFASDSDNRRLYGLANIQDSVIIKPIMQQFDGHGFINGLLKAVIDNKLTYINSKGEIVWQQNDTLLSLTNLNIDFMNRGYLYAYSTIKNPYYERSVGWATSSNFPIKISTEKFANNLFEVRIDTAVTDTFARRYLGYKLTVVNTTKDSIKFNAQDSRLYMNLQALNSEGEWKDIEYLPSSWCGNSYHTIQLEPNAYWSFIIPKYEGDIQTEIRVKLSYVDKANPKKQKDIYSNIINGSINPGQFWNKMPYYSTGLMDPYNN